MNKFHIKKVFIGILFTCVYLLFSTVVFADPDLIEHTDYEDFDDGSYDDTIDINISPGDIRLKRDLNSNIIDEKEEYELNNLNDYFFDSTSIETNSNDSITIRRDQVVNYYLVNTNPA
ncbi:hypothetical protein ACFLY9_02935, partial [Patescibacteria group bacterium]